MRRKIQKKIPKKQKVSEYLFSVGLNEAQHQWLECYTRVYKCSRGSLMRDLIDHRRCSDDPFKFIKTVNNVYSRLEGDF